MPLHMIRQIIVNFVHFKKYFQLASQKSQDLNQNHVKGQREFTGAKFQAQETNILTIYCVLELKS